MNHCRLLVLLWWWGYSVGSGSDWCHKQGRYYKPGQALAEELLTIIIRPWPPVPMTDEAKKDDVWSVENNTSLLWQCLSDGGSRQANLASPHPPPFSLFYHSAPHDKHLHSDHAVCWHLCVKLYYTTLMARHRTQSAQACGRDSVVAALTQLTLGSVQHAAVLTHTALQHTGHHQHCSAGDCWPVLCLPWGNPDQTQTQTNDLQLTSVANRCLSFLHLAALIFKVILIQFP